MRLSWAWSSLSSGDGSSVRRNEHRALWRFITAAGWTARGARPKGVKWVVVCELIRHGMLVIDHGEIDPTPHGKRTAYK